MIIYGQKLRKLFPVNNDVAWHDSSLVVHDQFRIVQVLSNLTVDAVVSLRWTTQVLLVSLKLKLSSWIHVTKQHRSVSVTIADTSVVVAFRGVGGKLKVESRTKVLEALHCRD